MVESSDIVSSWLQVIVQTAGVLVTLVFAILAVLWGSTVIPLSSAARALISLPLVAGSIAFLIAIWQGLDGLGVLTLALNIQRVTPKEVLDRVQPTAKAADLSFKVGIVLVVIASFAVTVISIIGI